MILNLLVFVFQSDILVPAKAELFLENGEEYIQLTQDHLGGIAPLYGHCRTWTGGCQTANFVVNSEYGYRNSTA